jgi:hypothetical protein
VNARGDSAEGDRHGGGPSALRHTPHGLTPLPMPAMARGDRCREGGRGGGGRWEKARAGGVVRRAALCGLVQGRAQDRKMRMG